MKKKKLPCHLFEEEPGMGRVLISRLDFAALREVETIYDDGSHDARKILQCEVCGCWFLYEFHEWIDWNEGNDEIYETYVPAPSREEALALNESGTHIRMMRPAIHDDYDGTRVLWE